MEATMDQPRVLNPDELAMLVKTSREMRKWSQEQLAELSGLSTRTVQRVETGKPSDLDTRRALARAFELEDIDAFNKPVRTHSEEELRRAQAEFERTHITLAALPVDSGRHLATLMAQHTVDMCTPGFDMPPQAEEAFAGLVDFLREYRDSHDLYSETDRLDVFSHVQSYIDKLLAHGITLRHARREIAIRVNSSPDAPPFRSTLLYLATYPKGEEPEAFVTPREVKLF